MWIGAEDRAHQDEEEAEANRQTASLGGLALALALVVIGLFLVRTLHEKAQIEDCLLSGRQDCDVLVTAEP
jgi:flagellar biogenesis protein FliO